MGSEEQITLQLLGGRNDLEIQHFDFRLLAVHLKIVGNTQIRAFVVKDGFIFYVQGIDERT
ncbi:hypothetical protein D3C79_1028280 [compost metagenome]